MRFSPKKTGKLFRMTFKEWKLKDPFRQSAVIAYYAIFSLPGLLVLLISIAGYFFGKDSVNELLFSQISGTMGDSTAKQIQGILANVSESRSTIAGSIIGMTILLLGATGVFVELQKSLNRIWKVKTVTRKSFLENLRARIFSFGLILAIAFLLIVSLVISAGLASMGTWVEGKVPAESALVSNVVNFILSLGIISVLFGLIFKILPDVRIKWKYIWPGSLVTGFLFTIGKTALGFYFGKIHPDSVYGAASSIILILLWVSYSSMILFFGAEFTAIYARVYPGKNIPDMAAKK
jgi:membrane protein